MRHALIDLQGRVRNVIIWEGAAFVPPAQHQVLHSKVAQLDDWWHEELDIFVTPDKKMRVLINGKCGSKELSDEHKKRCESEKFGPFHPEYQHPHAMYDDMLPVDE